MLLRKVIELKWQLFCIGIEGDWCEVSDRLQILSVTNLRDRCPLLSKKINMGRKGLI